MTVKEGCSGVDKDEQTNEITVEADGSLRDNGTQDNCCRITRPVVVITEMITGGKAPHPRCLVSYLDR